MNAAPNTITRRMTLWTLATYTAGMTWRQLKLDAYHYGTNARARRALAVYADRPDQRL